MIIYKDKYASSFIKFFLNLYISSGFNRTEGKHKGFTPCEEE
jgi:hypothetical protein